MIYMAVQFDYRYVESDNYYVKEGGYQAIKVFMSRESAQEFLREETKKRVRDASWLIYIILESEHFIEENVCIDLSEVLVNFGVPLYTGKADEFEEPCEEWVRTVVLEKYQKDKSPEFLDALADFFFEHEIIYGIDRIEVDEEEKLKENIAEKQQEILALEREAAAVRERIECLKALFI